MTNLGSAPCQILEWDTAFFGFRIARVHGDLLTEERMLNIERWCSQNRVACLYFLANSSDATTVRLAEDNRFRFVDIRLTLAQEIRPATGPGRDIGSSEVQIRRAHAADIPRLQEIARQAHHDTRFFYDAGFPRSLAKDLYATWIERSCTGFADQVFVHESEGLAGGYIACHLEQQTGRIGLIAVGTQWRGEGIGQALVQGALDWFAGQGMKVALVTTQGRNCTAQRLFQRCGFLSQKAELWYHKWYDRRS